LHILNDLERTPVYCGIAGCCCGVVAGFVWGDEKMVCGWGAKKLRGTGGFLTSGLIVYPFRYLTLKLGGHLRIT